jgi:hypothetical protein
MEATCSFPMSAARTSSPMLYKGFSWPCLDIIPSQSTIISFDSAPAYCTVRTGMERLTCVQEGEELNHCQKLAVDFHGFLRLSHENSDVLYLFVK